MERKTVPQSPQEVLVLCRQHDIKSVDFRFTDALGHWRHKAIPVGQLSEQTFEDGIHFDGSLFPGWTAPALLMVPLPETTCVDPFSSLPSLGILCGIQDPVTREEYASDPRQIARKAEYYLASLGIADEAIIGPEPQFYLFDSLHLAVHRDEVQYALTGPNNRPASGHAYLSGISADPDKAIRNEMMQAMVECGIKVESHHHESGAAQSKFGLAGDRLVQSADNVMLYKYIVKCVAQQHSKVATFMPKPVNGEIGSGMHTHLSWWKNGEPLFAGNAYGGLSESGIHALGGILRHAPAIQALTNPTTNSYRRLNTPGAPAFLSYSQSSQAGTACRVPLVSPSPKSKRIEVRMPDPSANPYLAFSALLMAAIDGVQNKIHPGESFERLQSRQTAVPKLASSLEQALDSLMADYEFLLRGDVFTEEFLIEWMHCKRNLELPAIVSAPHPQEFQMYWDV